MDTLAILRTLVGFDTTSHRSNLELIGWVGAYLDEHGVGWRLVHSDDGAKANLLATVGPNVAGGIVLSGHTDVVPVADQHWDSPPFTLVERDGRFHGRGSADMKGFIAACLAAVPHWRRLQLSRPIHLAFSYDEEVGCFGVPRLIADLRAQVQPPALAIIGEPTGMCIGRAHRGFYGHRTTFRGQPAHSSDPSLGTSAIEPAALWITALAAFGRALSVRGERTTFNIGRVSGGTAINIVPGCCEVLWEFRPTDAAGAAAARAEAERLLAAMPPGVAVEMAQLAGVPALVGAKDDAAVRLARSFGALSPSAEIPFGTEAGFFEQAGIPSLVCGPGAIAQAHQPNEWIAASQLEAADRFLARIGAWAAGTEASVQPASAG
ncbi:MULTISPECIES: acetylornithine deacetylase [unclassified Variovorax]|uniref:acetylornithine deacetylase n=1 Tax=unclassified Variovorax TaxID=663243 RepID=UPI002576CCB1|nr:MULTISPECIES: acetylornithine deacetylase [unclassified Variovorax]MDM0088738.1 acetylornithine deacetylase [Variovorax sp. J22G40]MDM0146811.1 acetylornithine deacetylase [Variovorax sp. J2P1-31]